MIPMEKHFSVICKASKKAILWSPWVKAYFDIGRASEPDNLLGRIHFSLRNTL
jgi:hypothetical protein